MTESYPSTFDLMNLFRKEIKEQSAELKAYMDEKLEPVVTTQGTHAKEIARVRNLSFIAIGGLTVILWLWTNGMIDLADEDKQKQMIQSAVQQALAPYEKPNQ